jgi:hypothetical protein
MQVAVGAMPNRYCPTRVPAALRARQICSFNKDPINWSLGGAIWRVHRQIVRVIRSPLRLAGCPIDTFTFGHRPDFTETGQDGAGWLAGKPVFALPLLPVRCIAPSGHHSLFEWCRRLLWFSRVLQLASPVVSSQRSAPRSNAGQIVAGWCTSWKACLRFHRDGGGEACEIIGSGEDPSGRTQ